MKKKKVIIKVHTVKGKCPVYKGGEVIMIEDGEINLKKSDRICIHALASLLHYVIAVRESIGPSNLGLAKKGKKYYIHCVDPGEPYTPGGEVIFELRKG